jgi:hypothetical protein
MVTDGSQAKEEHLNLRAQIYIIQERLAGSSDAMVESARRIEELEGLAKISRTRTEELEGLLGRACERLDRIECKFSEALTPSSGE